MMWHGEISSRSSSSSSNCNPTSRLFILCKTPQQSDLSLGFPITTLIFLANATNAIDLLFSQNERDISNTLSQKDNLRISSQCKENFQWQFAQFCRNQIFVTNYTLLGRAWIIWWNKKDKYQVWLIIAQQSDWNNWPLTASIWSRQRWHLAGKDVNRQALPQVNPTRMNENQISLSSEIKDSGCSVFNNPILPLKQLGCFPVLWLYVPGQTHYCIAVQCCITEHVLYYCTYTLYDAVHGI